MKTDKQFYQIIRACPELIYELAGLPPPGPCRTMSETFKELSRCADAVIEPLDESLPVCVVEVQHQLDASIYNRLAMEMALAQQQRNYRAVQGVILFPRRELDPGTQPWRQIIQPLYLDELVDHLRETQPDHLLLDLLAPTFLNSDTQLDQQVREHYHHLRSRNLPAELLDSLLAIFESWIYLHLKTHNRKALAMFLNIPTGDIAETVAGRELLEEGIERGISLGEHGMAMKIIRQIGVRHFGTLKPELESQITALTVSQKETLCQSIMDMGSWDNVSAWIKKQA